MKYDYRKFAVAQQPKAAKSLTFKGKSSSELTELLAKGQILRDSHAELRGHAEGMFEAQAKLAEERPEAFWPARRAEGWAKLLMALDEVEAGKTVARPSPKAKQAERQGKALKDAEIAKKLAETEALLQALRAQVG